MNAINLPLRNPAKAPAPKAEPVWNNIDPATLPEDLQRHYYAYKQAADLAAKARALFETEANEAFDTGPGNRLAFGYKFGRLSVAIVRDEPKTAKGALALTAIAKLR